MEEVRSHRPLRNAVKFPGLMRWAAGAVALCVWSVAVVFAAGGAGRIVVQTVPAGASVSIDGQPSGKSPATVEGLAPGRYFVRVELDGYRPAEVVVDLAAGQRYQTPSIELISESAPRPRATPEPVAAPAPVATPVPAMPKAAVPPLEAGGFPAAKESAPPMPSPALSKATPAPVATPAPPPATAVASPAATTPPADDLAVQSAVNDYLNSIADGDVEAYAQLCAPSVEFYEDGTKTPAAIRKIRQQFKERWPVYKIDNVRDGSIVAGDKPGVKRATVTYDWNVSNPKTGKKASGTATDQLDFRESKGKWLIVRTRQVVDRGRR